MHSGQDLARVLIDFLGTTRSVMVGMDDMGLGFLSYGLGTHLLENLWCQ